ncbi:glyoxylase family protein [Weissella kandleri]|uniref:Glyoxylase family protein n=1 Tax=Weissella kandleri TaxID=1616 RepID=A0A0R2JKK0_9LACO|nr:VOC family protein [Weissella kandleri]KRN74922.1 glyoxylase family protein [Weissella kandleri]
MALNLGLIHHIALNASNYEATRHFYVDLLGFKVIRETVRLNKHDVKLDLQMGNQELEIFIADNFPTRPSYPEALGLRHLAFKVDSLADVLQEFDRIGIKYEPVRLDDVTQRPMTFFFDPDDQPLELHE